MKTRTEVINKLFEKYKFKSYLEIGVDIPERNFDLINAELKHSVDPSPQGKCDFIMKSDEFFKNHVGNQKYDVIFVDGMHTAEQADVDVRNSIKCLNDGGFIVMHDCYPPTEYHTRSYEEFLSTKGAWNGTTFRSFIHQKHELTDWSCFVIDIDWGCGIITKRKLIENKQSKHYVPNIGWNEFYTNKEELLQLITTDKYCELINNDTE